MKNYKSFILEKFQFKNPKLVKTLLINLLKDIGKIDPKFTYDTIKKPKSYYLTINTLEYYKTKIDGLLNSCYLKLYKSGTFMNWTYTSSLEIELDKELELEIKEGGKTYMTYHIYFKEIFLERMKPPKYLYHASSTENRNSIKENGLKISQNVNFADTPELNRPDAIFASKDKYYWTQHFAELDVWRIDTTKITNKWWKDFNVVDKKEKFEDSCVTYENIPPNAIEHEESIENY